MSAAAATAGVFSAVRRAARLPPAEAMRPEPPANYRPALIEHTVQELVAKAKAHPSLAGMDLANVVTIGTAKWEKLVKTAGMAMRRVAEGAAGGESTNPKYSKIEIEAFEAEVEPWVYNATLEDSFVDLAADLAEEAAINKMAIHPQRQSRRRLRVMAIRS